MEIKTQELNVIVETLRRCEYKGTVIHNIITTAWGDNIISERRIQQIMKEYKGTERDGFDRKIGSGRPKSQKRFDLIPMIAAEIAVNKNVTCDELASIFNASHRMVYEIITNDLKKQSVQAKWVPHLLTQANKENRVICCQELIVTLNKRNIQRYLLVIDEKWFYKTPFGNAQTRRSWQDVAAPGDQRPTLPKRSTMDQKFMALVAANFEGLSYSEVLNRGQTVDSERYVNFINNAIAYFSQRDLVVERRSISFANLILMHDNARPHTSHYTMEYLQGKNVRLQHQAPYSPDLNLCDRMIFPMLEMKRSKITFSNINSLQEYLNEKLSYLSAETMQNQVEKLKEHCIKVINNNGEYII